MRAGRYVLYQKNFLQEKAVEATKQKRSKEEKERRALKDYAPFANAGRDVGRDEIPLTCTKTY
jgi:hypothetical protein